MWTWRFRGYADLHLGKHFRAYGEGLYSHSSIHSKTFASAPYNGAPNLNGDVLNAFGEYRGQRRARSGTSASGADAANSSSDTSG